MRRRKLQTQHTLRNMTFAPCPQAFNEEESEALLREWHKGENLQPIPPPTPNGFHKVRLPLLMIYAAVLLMIRLCSVRVPQLLTHGDEVEALYDDGWWRMNFMGTRQVEGGIEYNVWSDLYHVGRWVPADEVRPKWERWGSKWRKLEQLRKSFPPSTGSSSKGTQGKLASPEAMAPPKAFAQASSKAFTLAPIVAGRAPAVELSSPLRVPHATTSSNADDGGATDKASSSSAPPIHGPRCPIPQPPMTKVTRQKCLSVLQAMQDRGDAVWFAQPVSCAPRRRRATLREDSSASKR
jgi:hypothetical protein